MSSLIPFPFNIGYERVSWGIMRNVAVNESPLSSKIQRVVRAANRWKATLQFAPLQSAEAAHMAAFLDQLSAGDANVFVDGFRQRLGTLALTELLTNGGFEFNTTGWTASAATLNWNARHLRVTNSGGTGNGNANTASTTSGLNYVLLVDLVRGRNASWRVQAGATSVDFSATTRASIVFAGTGAVVNIKLGNTTSSAALQVQFANATVAQCLLVNNTAGLQTGSALDFDGGPASVTNALYAGELVTVITSPTVNSATPTYELKRLIEDVQTDSGGAGTIRFEPPIRVSPADNAGIILHRGFSRMMLPKHNSEFQLDGPNKHGFTLDMIEEI